MFADVAIRSAVQFVANGQRHVGSVSGLVRCDSSGIQNHFERASPPRDYQFNTVGGGEETRRSFASAHDPPYTIGPQARTGFIELL